ncbi:hypothetical protein J7K24_03415 [bacterium]|nr:hypothetical protein [bacterium]
MLRDFYIFNPLKKFTSVIAVTGQNKATTSQALYCVLRNFFKVSILKEKKRTFFLKGDILIIESNDFQEIKKFFKKTTMPILVVTAFSEIPPDIDFFASPPSRLEKVIKLVRDLPSIGFLVLNFDDGTVRDIKEETVANVLTFGFKENADFRATDIKLDGGTNFKINYKGNIVPVWLNKIFGREQIYSALAVAAVGKALKLNLVKISGLLKHYRSLPGKMRLIEGINQTWILDDAESATAFSMIEALSVLGEIRLEDLSDEGSGRKIAVLGDVIGIGKYTLEAHETIGEKVVEVADLLVCVGPRAKFIAQGAVSKGMSHQKIYEFYNSEEAADFLKKELRKGDLVLIDGSQEMKMEIIVNQLKTGAE